MKMIKPIRVTDEMLTSSVPVSSVPAYVAETSYEVDAEVLVGHNIYKSLVAANKGHAPEASLVKDRIVVEIRPNQLFNALAILNMEASAVLVTVTDPVAGEVYRHNVDMVDLTGADCFYHWFFLPVATRPNLILLDLPAYTDATVRLEISGLSDVEVGELVVGTQHLLGALDYGYSLGIIDYSLTTRDGEGNLVIDQKSYADELRYPIKVPSPQVYALKKLLGAHRAEGLVFVGDESAQESIVYGFIRDFNVTINGHLHSACTLEIEEMQ